MIHAIRSYLYWSAELVMSVTAMWKSLFMKWWGDQYNVKCVAVLQVITSLIYVLKWLILASSYTKQGLNPSWIFSASEAVMHDLSVLHSSALFCCVTENPSPTKQTYWVVVSLCLKLISVLTDQLL